MGTASGAAAWHTGPLRRQIRGKKNEGHANDGAPRITAVQHTFKLEIAQLTLAHNFLRILLDARSAFALIEE
jgi:hypothetical protein